MDMSYFDDPESLQWHRKSWEKFHKRGAAFYILVVGVLLEGVLPFVLITGWDVLIRHEQIDPVVAALCVLFWLLNGTFWGAVTWYFGEGRYLRAMKQQDPTMAR